MNDWHQAPLFPDGEVGREYQFVLKMVPKDHKMYFEYRTMGTPGWTQLGQGIKFHNLNENGVKLALEQMCEVIDLDSRTHGLEIGQLIIERNGAPF